jgi:transcription initiation factor TFIID subunit 2
MSSDSSPLIRQNLHRLFGKGVAAVAFGEESAQIKPALHDNLIIEQESSTEVRQANLARKQTIPGALEALKHDLSGNTTLKEALWAACNSPCVGLVELSDFVDICNILYEPVDSMMVVLKYPRYWKVEYLRKVRYHLQSNQMLNYLIPTLFSGTGTPSFLHDGSRTHYPNIQTQYPSILQSVSQKET